MIILRKISLVSFFLLGFNFCFSQKQYEYFGGIMLSDSISISYKIILIENKGEVKGYSITDLGGENETRSNIFGEYSKENKELSFRETGIVYTKSVVSQQDFCFINVTAKGFLLEKTKSFKTNFVGLFSDNTKCIDGKLFLNTAEEVNDRIDKVTNKINKSKKISDSIKQRINPIKIMDSINMNILRKNQVLSVFSKAKKINLIIYDGGKEDGDRISIKINEKIILKSYQANNIKKVIPIFLNDKKTSIKIFADNEGSIKPNTIVVEIDDNNNKIKALSNLKTGETTQIDILNSK
ncbi:MAG: hypothetical protein K9I95_05725 [Flavobacteriaceae bacterium]|nr:hypothetical protein [Flavobacteriaceae bacterium]